MTQNTTSLKAPVTDEKIHKLLSNSYDHTPDWQLEVANGDTTRGLTEWIEAQREMTIGEMTPEKAFIINNALSIAHAAQWDGCHKIWILLDETQVTKAIENGLSTAPELWINIDPTSTTSLANAFRTISQWYDNACPLKFITTIHTENETDIFNNIIEQTF